jgi:hypothetical protein
MDGSTPGQLPARLASPIVPRRYRACVAEVAIGVRDHSGWAVAVGVSAEPLVRDRRRIELCDPELPRQPFHSASGLPLKQAHQVIKQVRRSATAGAETELRRLLDDLAGQGHQVRAVAISIPTSSIPQDLRAILRSHPLLHAAEGELYREALTDAARAAELPIVRYVTRDVVVETAAALDCSPATVVAIAAKLGHGLGPPWAKDQKEAAMAALLALHTLS